MFKIGEFSKICLVSTKALRHWEEVGVLKPAHVDRETSYRYYSIGQLYEVNRILALQAMGLSLQQIRNLMREQITHEEIRGMFKLKRAEIQQELEDAQSRLKMLEARLNYIDEDDDSVLQEFDITLKSIDAIPILSMRRDYPTMQSFVDVLIGTHDYWRARAQRENWSYTAIFHDNSYEQEAFNVEIGYTIHGDTPRELTADDGSTLLRTTLPPSPITATTVHRGGWVKLSEGYNALGRWISDNNYQIAGAGREIFHRIDPTLTGDDFVTELQFPINKA